jgi:hypothetical protein
MAVVVGEMTVEPAPEPQGHTAPAPAPLARGPLPAHVSSRIDQMLRVQAERRERLRAD